MPRCGKVEDLKIRSPGLAGGWLQLDIQQWRGGGPRFKSCAPHYRGLDVFYELAAEVHSTVAKSEPLIALP